MSTARFSVNEKALASTDHSAAEIKLPLMSERHVKHIPIVNLILGLLHHTNREASFRDVIRIFAIRGKAKTIRNTRLKQTTTCWQRSTFILNCGHQSQETRQNANFRTLSQAPPCVRDHSGYMEQNTHHFISIVQYDRQGSESKILAIPSSCARRARDHVYP